MKHDTYLNNLLIQKNNNEIFKRYSNSENELRQLAKTNAHRSTIEAYNQCDNISTWMMNEGKVPWQFEYISRSRHENLKYLQNVQTFFFSLYIFKIIIKCAKHSHVRLK